MSWCWRSAPVAVPSRNANRPVTRTCTVNAPARSYPRSVRRRTSAASPGAPGGFLLCEARAARMLQVDAWRDEHRLEQVELRTRDGTGA